MSRFRDAKWQIDMTLGLTPDQTYFDVDDWMAENCRLRFRDEQGRQVEHTIATAKLFRALDDGQGCVVPRLTPAEPLYVSDASLKNLYSVK
ncbi:MAG: hypothetical protein KVP17_005358 [Porospora cf. gigantea B]|uniref:uncharacterized protein n=1 Tax=Porospora cf. gigantea B TaxID=2853592 RepID=UPI003571F9CD|nr:MAG: hypothetical protein KVP17_005358 [Porospora cf. gigantea B]